MFSTTAAGNGLARAMLRAAHHSSMAWNLLAAHPSSITHVVLLLFWGTQGLGEAKVLRATPDARKQVQLQHMLMLKRSLASLIFILAKLTLFRHRVHHEWLYFDGENRHFESHLLEEIFWRLNIFPRIPRRSPVLRPTAPCCLLSPGPTCGQEII